MCSRNPGAARFHKPCGHHDAGTAGGDVPGFGGLDMGKRPLPGGVQIVGSQEQLVLGHPLYILDKGPSQKRLDEGLGGLLGSYFEEVNVVKVLGAGHKGIFDALNLVLPDQFPKSLHPGELGFGLTFMPFGKLLGGVIEDFDK